MLPSEYGVQRAVLLAEHEPLPNTGQDPAGSPVRAHDRLVEPWMRIDTDAPRIDDLLPLDVSRRSVLNDAATGTAIEQLSQKIRGIPMAIGTPSPLLPPPSVAPVAPVAQVAPASAATAPASAVSSATITNYKDYITTKAQEFADKYQHIVQKNNEKSNNAAMHLNITELDPTVLAMLL